MKKYVAEIKTSFGVGLTAGGRHLTHLPPPPPRSSPEAALARSCHHHLEHLWLHQASAQYGAICGSSRQKWGADGLEQGKAVAKKFGNRRRLEVSGRGRGRAVCIVQSGCGKMNSTSLGRLTMISVQGHAGLQSEGGIHTFPTRPAR